MMRSTFRGSWARALSALAIGPVSRCERYSIPAGERYCTDCPETGPAAAATASHTVNIQRFRIGCPRLWSLPPTMHPLKDILAPKFTAEILQLGAQGAAPAQRLRVFGERHIGPQRRELPVERGVLPMLPEAPGEGVRPADTHRPVRGVVGNRFQVLVMRQQGRGGARAPAGDAGEAVCRGSDERAPGGN